MNFDSLVNIPMLEEEIFDRMSRILQQNFSMYQNVHVCLPLNLMKESHCSIKEVCLYSVKSEKDIAEKRHFIFGNEYHQAYAFARFMEGGFYWTSLLGHFVTKVGDVYPNSIEHIHINVSTEDSTKWKQPPLELILGAFDEMKQELKKKAAN